MDNVRLYKSCLLTFGIIIVCLANAADRTSISKAHSISIPTLASDSVSCVIPFNRVGNLIVIKARVDSTEGNFVLDTGAPGLVLNITYFRDYSITTFSDGEEHTIAGSSSTISKTSVAELSFGALQYYRKEADLTNLGTIENAKGIKLLGLLGVDLFKQCEMIIDFEKNLIYLHRIGRKESATYRHELLRDSSLYRTFPIDLSSDNRIVATTEMAGKKLKLVIDCAAESNILDSRLPNSIFENIIITRKVKLVGPGAKGVDALYGSLNNLKMGDLDIGNLPVTITNLEKTCFSRGGCVDGVLGFDFLSMHKIGFNFVNRKMYIWK